MGGGDTRDLDSIPGLGRSLEEGTGNPLQYSFLPGESYGQKSWWATVHWVAKESHRRVLSTICYICMGVGGGQQFPPPPPSNFLQHQQSVLQFNSVLTLITGQRAHQSPQVKGLVSQDCTLHSPTYPHSLLKPVTSPGWHLCFWSTGYRWGFK